MIILTIAGGLVLAPRVHAQDSEDAMIYPDSARQIIRGFGAANILPWRPDMTVDQIQTAFGTSDGELGFTILRLRVPLNTSEFAAQVPTASLAYSYGVTLIASPWSPPAAMKTNNNSVGGELKSGSYAAFAAHLKSFADYMSDHDAPLYAVSVQNEPDASVTYESCDWNADQFADFMKNHAASVGIPVMMPESMNFNPDLSDQTLNDPDAAANVGMVAGHLYGGGLARYPLADEKGKELWMTEYLDLDTTWTANLATGKQIQDCMNVGMNAYVWWYIVRFYGPILEDGTVSKRGYVMSQFSRFIRPGFLRIETRSPFGRNLQVYVSAYMGESELVIVAINQGKSAVEQEFIIGNLVDGSAVLTPYVTSKSQNCEQQADISVSEGRFTVSLAPSSITTFTAEDISVKVEAVPFPETVRLSQNYPNPFNPETAVSFFLPRSGHVTLKVYDTLGREVAVLAYGMYGAGEHRVKLYGKSLAGGIYTYRLQVDGHFMQTRKMLLLR